MTRRRDPTVRSLLRALKIEPVKEIAEYAMTLEPGDPKRIEQMWLLVPWVHYKPTAPVEVRAGDGPGSTTVVVIGGDAG